MMGENMKPSDKEILEKAIQKAIDGGFGQPADRSLKNSWFVDYGEEFDSIHDGLMVKCYDEVCNVESIIFNHDFAKALWGEEPADKIIPGWEDYSDEEPMYRSYDDPALFTGANWKYHLQQMVISEDPIKYLGDNI
jgi:hypothetical protein